MEFKVMDEFGESLPYRIAQFVAVSDSREDYSGKSNGLVLDRIPFGRYLYKLQRSDFKNMAEITGSMEVSTTGVWRTIVYHGGTILSVFGHPSQGDRSTPKGVVIRGVIGTSAAKKGGRWIRLQKLYESDGYEAPVDANGEFQVDSYLSGNYLLLIFEEGKLLHSVPITFRIGATSPETVVIEIPASAPSTIVVR